MKTSFIILFFLLSNLLTAQSNSDLAIGYYKKAEDHYTAENYSNAIKMLDEAKSLLNNKTNQKIEYLYTMIYLNKEDYLKAESHMSLFFNLNTSKKTTMYIEISKHIVDIREKSNIIRQKQAIINEAPKHIHKVECTNSSCKFGMVKEYEFKECWRCKGTGKVESGALSFLNGLTGSDSDTKVTCKTCKGAKKLKSSKKVKCKVCEGSNFLIKYEGKGKVDKKQINKIYIENKSLIDSYIELRKQFQKNTLQQFLPIRNKNYEVGFVDNNLNLIIPHEYDWARIISNEKAIVKKSSFYGVIDFNNEMIVPITFDKIWKGEDKVLNLKKEKETYTVNIDGTSFRKVDFFVKNTLKDYDKNIVYEIIEKQNELFLAINRGKTGDFDELTKYKAIPISKNIFKIIIGEKNKLFDTRIPILSEKKYHSIETTENPGLFKLIDDQNKQGFYYTLSYNRYTLVEPKYDEVSRVSGRHEKLFRSIIIIKPNKNEEKYGLIDFRGNMVLEPIYELIEFHKGYSLEDYIVVRKNGDKRRKGHRYDIKGNYLGKYKLRKD